MYYYAYLVGSHVSDSLLQRLAKIFFFFLDFFLKFWYEVMLYYFWFGLLSLNYLAKPTHTLLSV